MLLIDTSTYHCKSRRRGQADLEKRIPEDAGTNKGDLRDAGALRIPSRSRTAMPRRLADEPEENTPDLQGELGLQLRNKTPRRRVKAKLREDRMQALPPNETWAMDFVHDQLATGRKVRVLTVVDTFSKFSPVIDPRFSYRAENVVQTLDMVCVMTGYPKTIRVDQGSEFISRDLDLWAYTHDIILDFSRPGKPTDNAFILRRGNRSTGSIACPSSPSMAASGQSA